MFSEAQHLILSWHLLLKDLSKHCSVEQFTHLFTPEMFANLALCFKHCAKLLEDKTNIYKIVISVLIEVQKDVNVHDGEM
jgi:hypothetical protein